MSQYALIPCHRLLALFTLVLGLAFPIAATAEARLSDSYGKLPLHFEANQGQAHQDVRFLSRGPGYSLTSEIVFSASGLAPDVTHTLVITVTGATTGGTTLLTGGSHVAVDAFDVTR